MGLTFCMQMNVKASYKVILSLLMGMIKHSQSTQSNKFVISLIFEKKVKEGVHFLQQINMVSTSWQCRF